jgi:protein TIF31
MQDLGFTVKVAAPGVEPFDIQVAASSHKSDWSRSTNLISGQVSSMELVQEIHQLLMDREDTCHRTCFSLQVINFTINDHRSSLTWPPP